MRRNYIRVICLLATAALLCCAIQAAGAETWYVENEWNYMDASMDVSKGIPEDASGALAQIQRKGVLRVATDLSCAPFNFTNPDGKGDKQYAGVDMELARLIAKKMGVELVIVPKKSIYKLPALSEDLADLTISTVACTPGRALYYTLSKGYYYPEGEDKDIGILVREETEISSMEDLRDKVIVAESNSVQEAFGAAHIEDYLEFRRASSVRNVYKMVADGRAFAGIVSIRIAETYIQNHPDCGLRVAEDKNLRFPVDSQYLGYRVAAKKGETQLIAFVNGVIDEAEKTKQFDKWNREATELATKLGLLGQ